MSLNMEAGAHLTYVLPTITDPDGDAFTMKINLGAAIVFTSISGNTLTFNPNYKGDFKIQISLADLNLFPRIKSYTLLL